MCKAGPMLGGCIISIKGVLNISHTLHIHARGSTDTNSWRDCSKKSVQQGHSYFDARSIQRVREHGKMARTPLAAFFNIPIKEYPAFVCCPPTLTVILVPRKSIWGPSPFFSAYPSSLCRAIENSFLFLLYFRRFLTKLQWS